jgi:hypothetical protein
MLKGILRRYDEPNLLKICFIKNVVGNDKVADMNRVEGAEV